MQLFVVVVSGRQAYGRRATRSEDISSVTRWPPRRTVHGEALALVVAFIAAYEVLEVVLRISDRANFVILVDEVTASQS